MDRSAMGRRRALGYLATAAVAGLLLAVTVTGLNVLGARADLMSIPGSGMLDRQLGKIDEPGPIDILLVGDSSLGNAVDARQWSAITGLKVVNAALTGRYGYVGSRNVVRRALRQDHPRMVIVMQTLDMATRKPSITGDLLTAERWQDVELYRPGKLVQALASFDPLIDMLDTLLGREQTDDAAMTALDYVPQRRDLPDVEELLAGEEPLRVADIDQDNLAALAEIGAQCRASGIRCVYAHGPLLEPLCSASSAFVSTLGREITALGFTVVAATPVCVGAEQIGDAVDHVRNDIKPEISARYLELVLEATGGMPAPAPAR